MALRPIRLPTQGARQGTIIKARAAARGDAMLLRGFESLSEGIRSGVRERTRKTERKEELDYRKSMDAKSYGLAEQRLAMARSQMATGNWTQAANMALTQRTMASQAVAEAQRSGSPEAVEAAWAAFDKADYAFNHATEQAQAGLMRGADFATSVNAAVGVECKPGGG